MKRSPRIPMPRSVSLVVGVYTVVIILLLVWAAQLLSVFTSGDPGRSRILLVLSFIFPILLLALVAASLSRVLIQRRSGEPGSRLRLRLIGSFALTVLVTVLPVGLLSGLFLRTAIGVWLAPGNGRALEAGGNLASELHGEALERLEALAGSEYLAVLLDRGRDAGDVWKALKDVAPYLDAMQVDGGGADGRMGDPSLFLPESALSLGEGDGALPRRVMGGRTVLSWRRRIGNRRVVLTTVLPDGFESDIGRITQALDEWRRYDGLKGKLGGSLALFGLFLVGPLALMALLIGMTLSERVIRPLVTLGEATAKITEGDFSFRVLAPKDDELAFLTQSFNRMIRELEVSRTKIVQTEKVAAWQVIAQRLAHELRNPLTPIKLSAQRVQRKALEGRTDAASLAESMELILKEVDGLDKLLQDFRAFAGGGPPKLEPLPLRPFLEETLERFRTVEPSVEWVLMPGNDDPEIQADGLQLRQAVVNLLKNAMEAGSSRVSIRVDVVRRGSTAYARLQVRDDLAGQPEGGAQHYPQKQVQAFVIGLVQRFGAAQPGVIDEKINPPEARQGQFDNTPGRFIGSNIDGQGDHALGVVECIFQQGQLAGVAADPDNRHAHIVQLPGRGETYTTARSGNDCNLHCTVSPLSDLLIRDTLA